MTGLNFLPSRSPPPPGEPSSTTTTTQVQQTPLAAGRVHRSHPRAEHSERTELHILLFFRA